MVAPSLRVPLVSALTSTGATSTPGLVVDSTTVAGDYLVLSAVFGTGTSTVTPAAHPVAALTGPTGWTQVSQAVTSTDTEVVATFVKKAVAGDIGSTVTVTCNTSARCAAELAVVKGAAGYTVTDGGMLNGKTTFGLPAFNLPVDSCFGLAVSGNRYPASTTPGAAPALTGWTAPVNNCTTNATGQLIGVWGATQSWGTGTAGTVAAVSAAMTAATLVTYDAVVLVFSPPTSSVVANAGANTTVPSFGSFSLTGTTSGGSGSLSSQTWSQVSGPTLTLTQFGATVSATVPGAVPGAGVPVVLQYAVTDTNATTSSSQVTVTISPSPYVLNIGGVLKPGLVGTVAPPGPPPPPVSLTGLTSVYPGGGGQSCASLSTFSTGKMGFTTDTGGPRFTVDQTKTNSLNLLGLPSPRSKLGDGIALSTVTDGVAFMTCGDSTAGTGGVFISSGVYSTSASAWTQLDGTVAGAPNLIFNGGNNNLTSSPGAPRLGTTAPIYPRHYGGTIILDDTSLSGFTLLHVATVTDGAWRLKVRNSDWTCVEQVQYPGTAGTFCRSVAFAGSKSRLFISVYDSQTPTKPRLSTNANIATGSSMTTAAITGAPANVENFATVAAPGGSTVPLSAIVAGSGTSQTSLTGDVLVSTNAHTAAAGAITFTSVAGPGGPETTAWWMAVGLTYVPNGSGGYNHVLVVGAAFGGVRITSTNWHTVWRGVVPATSTAPASNLTWTLPTFGEQVLGGSGAAATWWLAGVETPNMSGQSAVSAFTVSPLDPNLMTATCKGDHWVTYDAARTWAVLNIGGSADHTSGAWDLWNNTARFAGTSGDWPLIASQESTGPARTFDAQGQAVIKYQQADANGVWFDSRTGDVFIGANSTVGGHAVPNVDPNNVLLSMTGASLDNSYVDLSPTTDWGLPMDTTLAGVAAATCVMGGVVGYGSSPTSAAAIMVARINGGGLIWRNKTSTAWHTISAVSGTNPYTTNPPNVVSLAPAYFDATHNVAYFFERGPGIVWSVTFSASGVPSAAKRLFQKAYTYTACEGIGFVDVDEANDILWISTKAGVYYLTGASTAAHVAGTTDTNGACTASAFAATYPGEIPGPMHWLPGTSALWVKTMYYSGGYTPVYPLNGADGGRDLLVTSPTTDANWSPSAVNDLSVTRDRTSRIGIIYPKWSARNVDGSMVAFGQQGSGMWTWRIT